MLNGMVPLNLLPSKRTYSRDVASPIVEGMAPTNRLPLRSTCCNDVIEPRADGMEPDIPFSYNRKTVMFLKAPISDGIVPINL